MTLTFSSLRIALYEPQIPPNTGNIARTSAAFQLPLSLIEPLGFTISDRTLKRAGLDYWPHVDVTRHKDFNTFMAELPRPSRLIGCSRHQGQSLSAFEFREGDVLLFGREDSGLPPDIRQRCDAICTIPMRGHDNVRSLNLSVACALVTFQAGLRLGLW